MKSHLPPSSCFPALTRRRFLTTLAPLGLGTALLGMPLNTALAATRMPRQKSLGLSVSSLSAPVLAPSQNGRLELFTIDYDGRNISHPPGGTLESPVTAANPDGRLELFGIGSGGVLWHTWQTSVGGSWVPSPGTVHQHAKRGYVFD